MDYSFRKANLEDLPGIWEILKGAIQRRKEDGSDQWQDGYPNPEVIRNDIDRGVGYVLSDGDVIAAYCAILINDEPAYAALDGKWLTDGDFVVYHRVAVSEKYLGRGLAQQLLTHRTFCTSTGHNQHQSRHQFRQSGDAAAIREAWLSLLRRGNF